MKTKVTILALLVALSTSLTAQTTYNVAKSMTYSAANIPTQCVSCVINIADGATLTIDKDIQLQNVAINGGSVSKSKITVNSQTVTFWSEGSFTNIIADFKNATLVNSAPVTFTNSTFTFTNKSVATVYTSISLISSTWKLLDNADMTSTGGTFSIKNGSLVVGDGSAASKATAIFNGGALSLLDAVSFVTMASSKNSYFNWSTYNGNGKAITTTNNTINCGGSNKNECSAPVVYGPSTLTAAGVSANAMLPVKLISFSAKTNNSSVVLKWITAQEINAEVFEIERSADGISWTKIGTVAAKGNSSVPSTYSYAEVVKAGASFTYRLKMVDIDKQFEYSPIVKASLNGVAVTSIKTYPNPATEFFAVDGASAGSQVQVVNMNGAVVKVINGYVANAKVSLNGVVAGNYVVKVVDANGASQALKMIVAR